MVNGYEREQTELKQELESIKEMDMRKFMDKAKEYIEMPKLTPELLRVFIRKIETRKIFPYLW